MYKGRPRITLRIEQWLDEHNGPAVVWVFLVVIRLMIAGPWGFWAAMGILVGYAVFLIFRRRRVDEFRKIEDRICLTFGYDLRTSPERCPECGTPVPDYSGPLKHPPPYDRLVE